MGKNVFINPGCRFQDQGGITIGDGAIIAAGAVVIKDVCPNVIVAITFALAGCSNTAANKVHSSIRTSAVSENSSAAEFNSQTDSTKEATSEGKMITMNVTVGSTTFTATLEDNDTAKAFVKQLPLTVDMSELNGNEKFNYLLSNLRADTPSRPDMINEGDLMLYGNNCLVLFYKTFNTSYSYVKLGHINNTTGLVKALDSGSVWVIFSVSR